MKAKILDILAAAVFMAALVLTVFGAIILSPGLLVCRIWKWANDHVDTIKQREEPQKFETHGKLRVAK